MSSSGRRKELVTIFFIALSLTLALSLAGADDKLVVGVAVTAIVFALIAFEFRGSWTAPLFWVVMLGAFAVHSAVLSLAVRSQGISTGAFCLGALIESVALTLAGIAIRDRLASGAE